MDSLYLDHHILVDENNWEILRKIVDQRLATLAISSWNIVELSQAEDNVQKQRRCEFVQSLSPIYVLDMLTLQRCELRSFTWLYYFGAGLYPYSAFASTFAEYLQVNFQLKVRNDYALLDYFRNARPEHLAPITAGQQQMTQALQTLQTANKKQLKQVEAEAFRRYLSLRIPDTMPDGRPVNNEIRSAIVQRCVERESTLNRLCPALFAEEALGEKRRQDPRRRPKKSDTADLMHSAVGLAYCDVFVTNDTFAVACCEHAKRRMADQNVKSASLFRSLQAYLD